MDTQERVYLAPGPSARPTVLPSTRRLVDEALRNVPATPAGVPAWSHRLLPVALRSALAGLGWWHNPTPQPPSRHLQQTLAVLEKYGWCQSLDVTATGRLCIRGAQNLLEKTGHVTPHARQRAVHHMHRTLAKSGVTMQFFAWNDLPGQEFTHIRALLTEAARTAHQNGE